MSEHTPAPTPSRAIYGFVFFLLFKSLFIIYVFWAYIPQKYLDYLGLTYFPDKYFALYLPILVLVGTTLFAFFIYPSFGMAMTPDIDSICTIRDSKTIRRCEFVNDNERKCDNKIEGDFNDWAIPKYCSHHTKRNKSSCGPENTDKIEEKIIDFCDCPDKTKCLIKTKKEHIHVLRTKKSVPNVADLDISDVCRDLYGNLD